ncbi:MAG TPA: 1,4-alpha-glucan branching protein domain-containing protein [Verrucomicrobiae bacterium]|nr:1,4-alpha-glucan branching protein domain-containing protein [Verrucomicrobiae bacterium]
MNGGRNVCIVLHAHMPYVRHPRDYEKAGHRYYFEEVWLFEAITDCYLPLLNVFERLRADDTPFALTMSFSATLLEMLDDEYLRDKYLWHLSKLIAFSETELSRTAVLPGEEGRLQHETAKLYANRLVRNRDLLRESYDGSVVNGFKKFVRSGNIEVLSTGATHAVLPLLPHPAAVDLQMAMGRQATQHHFGCNPTGFWLPENAYGPGMEENLKKNGFEYFLSAHHTVENAHPKPPSGVYAPIRCPNGVLVLPRHPFFHAQLWGIGCGYPGDFNYREYYRDAGWDLPFDAVSSVLPTGSNDRCNIGFKYHRITGVKVPLGEKALYNPEAARNMAITHAGDMLHKLETVFNKTETPHPTIVVSNDAELYGHWWFEGPDWLEHLFRQARGREHLHFVTCGAAISSSAPPEVATPAHGTWGAGGFFGIWTSARNMWVWSRIQHCFELWLQVARMSLDDGERACFEQATKEMLLLQSSDWLFMIANNYNTSYPRKRIEEHFNGCVSLLSAIINRRPGESPPDLSDRKETQPFMGRFFDAARIVPDGRNGNSGPGRLILLPRSPRELACVFREQGLKQGDRLVVELFKLGPGDRREQKPLFSVEMTFTESLDLLVLSANHDAGQNHQRVEYHNDRIRPPLTCIFLQGLEPNSGYAISLTVNATEKWVSNPARTCVGQNNFTIGDGGTVFFWERPGFDIPRTRF